MREGRIHMAQYENWREINALVCLILVNFYISLTFEIVKKVDNITVVRDYILWIFYFDDSSFNCCERWWPFYID